jgi:hypothetical protein
VPGFVQPRYIALALQNGVALSPSQVNVTVQCVASRRRQLAAGSVFSVIIRVTVTGLTSGERALVSEGLQQRHLTYTRSRLPPPPMPWVTLFGRRTLATVTCVPVGQQIDFGGCRWGQPRAKRCGDGAYQFVSALQCVHRNDRHLHGMHNGLPVGCPGLLCHMQQWVWARFTWRQLYTVRCRYVGTLMFARGRWVALAGSSPANSPPPCNPAFNNTLEGRQPRPGVVLPPCSSWLCARVRALPAGTFHIALSPQLSCQPCQTGSFSLPGAGKCLPCTSNANCLACAADTGKCTSCGTGYALDSVKACSLCDAGYGQTTLGGPCSLCAPGTYHPDASTSTSLTCATCPIGQYSDAPGAVQCKPCTVIMAGFVCQAGATASSGVPCPAGTYSSATGASVTACTPCPVGTYTLSTGSISVSACTRCPAGTYGATTGLATAACTGLCPAGTFSGQGATACSPCAVGAGSYCPPGSTSSTGTLCAKGSYSGGIGAVASCTLCPVGTYGESEGLTSASCTDLCPLGTYGALAGLTTVECTANCPVGRYGDTAGQTTSGCSGLCPAGTYGANDGLMSAACNGECSQGCVCAPGSTSDCPTLCPVNTYGGGAIALCTPCPAGTAATSPGNVDVTDCEPCPVGRASSAGQPCRPCSVPAGA